MPDDGDRVIERRSHAATWVIAVSLAVIAVCLVLRLERSLVAPAFAQQPVQAGARGIFAFSGQLTETNYGLFMVDVDNMTLWCYEYLPGSKQLRLVAARKWMYDRYLEAFHTAKPLPDEVEQLVEEQRVQQLKQAARRSP